MPRARAADAARCCQMHATTTAANASSPTMRLIGAQPAGAVVRRRRDAVLRVVPVHPELVADGAQLVRVDPLHDEVDDVVDGRHHDGDARHGHHRQLAVDQTARVEGRQPLRRHRPRSHLRRGRPWAGSRRPTAEAAGARAGPSPRSRSTRPTSVAPGHRPGRGTTPVAPRGSRCARSPLHPAKGPGAHCARVASAACGSSWPGAPEPSGAPWSPPWWPRGTRSPCSPAPRAGSPPSVSPESSRRSATPSTRTP